MSRKLDTGLIGARMADLNQIVQEGKSIEEMESEGKTPESIKAAARKVLGLDEKGSILLEQSDIVKSYNLQADALRSIVNFNSKAKETNLLTEEEISVTLEIEAKIAKVVSELFDIDLEDIYSEGD